MSVKVWIDGETKEISREEYVERNHIELRTAMRGDGLKNVRSAIRRSKRIELCESGGEWRVIISYANEDVAWQALDLIAAEGASQ